MNWQDLRERDDEARVLLAYAASISDPHYREKHTADDPDQLTATRERIAQRWKAREEELSRERKPHALPEKTIRPIPMRKAAGA